MTPTEKYDAASKVWRVHSSEHYKLQQQYEISLKKLKELDRAMADAWREMTAAPHGS